MLDYRFSVLLQFTQQLTYSQGIFHVILSAVVLEVEHLNLELTGYIMLLLTVLLVFLKDQWLH